MTLSELEKLSFNHPILFFDGHCVICNRYVRWLLKLDGNNVLRFGQLSSSIGKEVQSTLNFSADQDTVVLIKDGKYCIESDVVFQVIKKLGGIYLIFYPLVVIPKIIRNNIYRWISRNRYRWFGRLPQCIIIDESQQYLFVDWEV